MKSTYKQYIIIFFISFFIGVFNHNQKSAQRSPSSANEIDNLVRNLNYDRNYLALNPEKDINGFVHVEGRDSEYMQRLFGEILQEAHRIAAKDFYIPDENQSRLYNGFLLNALVVPFHESSLMHITKRKTDNCYLGNDLVDKSFHGSDSAVSFIRKILENENDDSLNEKFKLLSNPDKETLRLWISDKLKIAPQLDKGISSFLRLAGYDSSLFPACHKFKSKKFYQLLFGSDYADIGLYQLNTPFHHEMMKEGDLFDTVATIKYGLNYLYSGDHGYGGYRRIANNYKSFNCLQGDKDSVDFYKNILRGNWAGQFNMGQISETCRFADTIDPDDRDFDFKDNLETMLRTDKAGEKPNFLFLLLPKDSIERKAYLELISNFNNLTNNRTYIDEVLKTDYSNVSLYNKDDDDLKDESRSVIAQINEAMPTEQNEGQPLNKNLVEQIENTDDGIKQREYKKSFPSCQIPPTLRKVSLDRTRLTKDKISSQVYDKDYTVGPGKVPTTAQKIVNDSYLWYATFDKDDCKEVWFFAGVKDLDL